MRKTLHSLLKSMESDSDDDVMALSLFQVCRTYKFLFLTHFFSDIMSELALVSKALQLEKLSYSQLTGTIRTACCSIEQQYLVQKPSYGPNLREFLTTYETQETFHGVLIKRSHKDTRLPVAVSEFAEILLNSIQERFPKIEIWEAMMLFNPADFPSSTKDKADYGNKQISVLLKHFGKEIGGKSSPVCEEGALREFSLFKNHMFDLKVSSFEGLADKILSQKETWAKFPNMTGLLAICRVLPVSTVDCERGFSAQNLIKTRLRCRMGLENLDNLMRVAINGPDLSAFEP